MVKRKSPSDREKNWEKVFNALVQLSQNLKEDSHVLEGRIRHLHEFIYKMKLEQKVEPLKADLLLGLKERDAFVYKHRYEERDSDLADCLEWIAYLNKMHEEKKVADDVSIDKGEGTSQSKALRNEVRKLKGEIEKCRTDKSTEISTLLEEKNFVWNQFKKMETDLHKEIKKKDEEVKRANEKALLVQNRVDELQAANDNLRTELARMEAESTQKSEELKLLKSKSGSQLRLCSTQTEKTSAHKLTEGKAPRKQLSTHQGSNSSSSSRRKAVDVLTIPETPRLFNSSFQVPKLKASASPNIV